MPAKHTTLLTLTSNISTHTWGFGQKALGVLYAADERLHPDRVGLDETDLRKKLPCKTVEDVRPLWAPGPGKSETDESAPNDILDDLYWRRSKPLQTRGDFRHSWYNQSNDLLPAKVHLTSNFRVGVDLLKPFCEWCKLYTPEQGYLHLVGPEESSIDLHYDLSLEQIHSGDRTPEMIQKDGWTYFLSGVFGVRWDQKRFNLGAINYLPQDLVTPDIISKLESNGLRIEPLGEGFLLFLCDTLEDLKDDFPSFSRKRAVAKKIIGEERFVIQGEPI